MDNLVDIIKRKGPGCALWKRDLKRDYRQLVWIDPRDIPYLGFSWGGRLYFDPTGPMGLRSSAGACQRTAEGLAYMFQCRNPDAEVVPYQDDIGAADTWDQAWKHYNDWGRMLEACNIQESPSKACPPSTSMVFLGILCDTVRLVLEVPPDKVVSILSILDTWLAKDSATLKETQSLAGKLAWMSALVVSGRVFLSRIFAYISSLPHQGAVPIDQEVRKDIAWWRTFLVDFNGVSMMLVEDWSMPDQVFETDACLSGIGGWDPVSGAYFHKVLPEKIAELGLHISEIELLAICIALKAWGRHFARKKIIINCDNEASVQVLNSGRCKNAFMQKCLREIAYHSARFSCQVRAKWIQGVSNRYADALSRWHLSPEYVKEFHACTEGRQTSEVFIFDGLFEFSHDW